MDFKFSKDSGESQPQEAPDDKKKQNALLVLLLLLVGGFTYVYFFTGLIKPQEAEKPVAAQTPAVKAEIVKIPLPAREGETVNTEVKPANKGTVATAAAPDPAAAKTVPTPAKQAPLAAVKPVIVPPKGAQVAKTAPVKTEPKKAAAKPVEKKIEPVVAAAKKPAGAVKSSVVADKKSLPAKAAVKKPATAALATADTKAKTKKPASGPWTLIVGNYLLEEAISADMGRVRKAGFQPVMKASSRKKAAMNRLLVAEFSDRTSAQPTLEKLKKHTSDAFVIQQGDKFDVVAGSYLQTEAAQSEKERLKAAGFAVTIKHIDISIPSQTLSVGPFTSRKAADSALARLRNSGIKATLAQK